ncbi:NADH-quinone oxidoreductase subunit M [Candidatus Sumerlaeota bacterium]|nr:NADH-quinone oxidoreductase subunit M [Candidatus Sumerlaeota bacterium]
MEHLTTILIFLPAAAALLILLLAKTKNDALTKGIALAATALSTLLSLAPLYSREFFSGAISLGDSVEWFSLGPITLTYTVGMDSLSLLMVILTNGLMVIAVLASWTAITKRLTEYYFFLLLLHTGMVGTFCAFDIFLFYVFWELMLIPMFFLIGVWGSTNRLYATIKFVLYTLAGSVLMLVAVLFLCFKAQAAGAANFTYQELIQLFSTGAIQLTAGQESLMFLAFFVAFAIKVPLFPFHTWLPDAHTEAPTAGSIILAGVLLKTGAYGILRFCLPFFPHAAVAWAPVICWLSVIAIIYGAATAIAQQDMKRLVAYSSVSHMGFVTLGIFAFTLEGLSGSVLQMIGHGISTGGLFLGVGILYERRHTRLMADYGGVAGVMKVFCVLMVIIVLASAGLPGLNGFVGEFLILAGTFLSDKLPNAWLFTALAATGVVLGAVYLLIMVQRVFFGPVTIEENKSLPDLNPRELFCMCALVAMAFWIGLYPKPFLSMIERSYAMKNIESRLGIEPREYTAVDYTSAAVSHAADAGEETLHAPDGH